MSKHRKGRPVEPDARGRHRASEASVDAERSHASILGNPAAGDLAGHAAAPATPALTPVGFDYRKLALASPLSEFEAHAARKIKTAERLGQKDEVEVMLEAFEIGKLLLARKTEGQS